MNVRKWFLIASGAMLIISLCVIFPIEKKSEFVGDLVYTFITLGIAIFLGMYGLMGKKIINGLFLILSSIVISFVCWYIVFYNDFWGIVPAIYGGIPSGIISGLLFLIVDYKWIEGEDILRLFFKRLIVYSIILLIVSVIAAKGGDWMFNISQYFKVK